MERMLQALHADSHAGLYFTHFCEVSGNPVRKIGTPILFPPKSLYDYISTEAMYCQFEVGKNNAFVGAFLCPEKHIQD